MTCRRTKLLPLAIITNSQHNMSVSTWENLIGGDIGMGIAQALGRLARDQKVGRLIGQHGSLTLRLVPRRVAQSTDNTRFRILADQDRNCQFPGLN